MIITSQHVHSRDWIVCPSCEGGKLFTAKERNQGVVCVSCDNKGEVPRFPIRKSFIDNSSYYEQMFGA